MKIHELEWIYEHQHLLTEDEKMMVAPLLEQKAKGELHMKAKTMYKMLSFVGFLYEKYHG